MQNKTICNTLQIQSIIRRFHAFSRKRIVKEFVTIGMFDFASRPVQIIKGFIIARYLGPSSFGILKSLELIEKLNKYGNLGFKMSAKVMAGSYIGAGEFEKAAVVKSTAFTAELLLSLALFAAGVISTLFIKSHEIAILVVLASFGLFSSKLNGILQTEALIQKRFVLISKVTFYSTICTDIIAIMTVPFFKIYAVMITNIITSLLSLGYFFFIIKFRFPIGINLKELKPIFKVSIPLLLITLAQGSFEYAEKIMILTHLGKVSLGYFGFATMIAGQVLLILKISIRIREQDIFQRLGREAFKETHIMVLKETLMIMGLSILAIPVIAIILPLIIPYFLPKWKSAINIYQLYLFIIPLQLIINYPTAVLISTRINKKSTLPIYRCLSTGLLVISTVYLKHINLLSLKTFILIDLFCYLLYSMTIVMLYKYHFYDRYIKPLKTVDFTGGETIRPLPLGERSESSVSKD